MLAGVTGPGGNVASRISYARAIGPFTEIRILQALVLSAYTWEVRGAVGHFLEVLTGGHVYHLVRFVRCPGSYLRTSMSLYDMHSLEVLGHSSSREVAWL